MPDARNYNVTRTGTVSATIPQFSVTCDIVNSKTGVVLQSFNTTFSAMWLSLTTAEQDKIMKEQIIPAIYFLKSQAFSGQ